MRIPLVSAKMFFKRKQKKVERVDPIPMIDFRSLRDEARRDQGEDWEARERNRDLARQLRIAR